MRWRDLAVAAALTLLAACATRPPGTGAPSPGAVPVAPDVPRREPALRVGITVDTDVVRLASAGGLELADVATGRVLRRIAPGDTAVIAAGAGGGLTLRGGGTVGLGVPIVTAKPLGGALVTIDAKGVRSALPFGRRAKRFCIFEYIYFARPDSIVDGLSVYEARKRIGAELAREHPVPADVVIPVPDSGVPAALGYAAESGLPFELGIIRNHYVGRTFIEPTDQIRHLGVKLKHNANRALIQGKRVVLIDDSIVRGTTSLKIVQMMREAGAAEVHMRIASPPTRHSCFYGVDTPERTKLLAAKMDLAEMTDFIHADSLAFISIDGLYKALGEARRADIRPSHCDACFTGAYPTTLTDQDDVAAPIDQLALLAERVN